ncbi:hypothetical protein CEUSTIGMA_g9706.t1 [Chlamydomonas eustigma]|uniref:t-SNARE coiled-coil homology domain-containing protein n=1 Tax=Chlamydomonas eustigma TaxID=1157962 RepID=A0A250XGS3_9CHLO|nr:hypothetical protein CEUSTIGMA_g9706.t1 [Chlamydomonas eustigma]|eukprot:GAX82277.1 hypothetical protein CEUSTIGMA_g9706.t1 [Chlamydomonas eustigma]
MRNATSSSVKERTSEFASVVERIRKQQGILNSASATGTNGVSGMSEGPDSKTPLLQSEFSRRAADIGHGIHRTSLKLQKLAQLAKRTSMFDDNTSEVEELTGMIKQDIQAMNAAIAELQKVSAKASDASKQSADHSHTVVDSLRSRLKDATAEFKDVLTTRTDNLKHHKERRGLFSVNNEAESAMPLLPPQHRNSVASGHHFQPSSAHNAGVINGSSGSTAGLSGGGPAPPSFLQQSSQQQQQLVLSQPQDTYLTSRAEALRNVESTIVELGTIFNKLGEMVAQQGEVAIRIDENIDDTLSNVTGAQAQLMKYLNTVSSNRWLIMKVFAVLMAFLILFVVFIA